MAEQPPDAQIKRISEVMDSLAKAWAKSPADSPATAKRVQTRREVLDISRGLLERVDRDLAGGGQAAATTVTVTVTITVTTLDAAQDFEAKL